MRRALFLTVVTILTCAVLERQCFGFHRLVADTPAKVGVLLGGDQPDPEEAPANPVVLNVSGGPLGNADVSVQREALMYRHDLGSWKAAVASPDLIRHTANLPSVTIVPFKLRI